MSDNTLSKTTLIRTRKKVKIYKSFLPALNLKKQKLLLTQSIEREKQRELLAEQLKILESIEQDLPMLAAINYDLSGFVKITNIKITEENIVGTKLPNFELAEYKITDINNLGAPFWIYRFIDLVKLYMEYSERAKIVNERVKLLHLAAIKVTQKINLFEKILLPQSQNLIKKINIFLEDGERAGVVRSKIAKRKRIQ